jgi:ABC-type transport system substrate-binding protein
MVIGLDRAESPIARFAGEVLIRLLARNYGPRAAGRQRFFEHPGKTVRYLALNTGRPLFAAGTLRRAVAYAVDRTALAAEQRRFFQAQTRVGGAPTGEYLPRPLRISNANLYPEHPDLARARQLAGGTSRTAVLYSCTEPPCPQQAAIVKRDLARIGIDVVVQAFPKPVMYDRAFRPAAAYDMLLVGWVPDFFDPAGMLNVLAFAHFDEPRFKRRQRGADRLSGPARNRAYDALARDLARASPIVVYADDASINFFSARVGCQVYNPVYGIDLGALCIRHPER